METPLGTWLTVPLALASIAWSIGGNLYGRRMLAGLPEAVALGQQHLEWSRSTTDPLAKRLHLAKARHATRPLAAQVERNREYQRRVYRPVAYGLSAATAVCALWGLGVALL